MVKKAGKKSLNMSARMIEFLLEPFAYSYMVKAICVCALVGATCAFLSTYLILKGWSLMGDALSHAVVPGVALAYLLALPYAVGAFFAGLLAALSIVVIKQKTKLREDAVIGLIFTSFFAFGLLLVSINPTAVNIQAIILGNILAISDTDMLQVLIISLICLGVLIAKWRDFLAVFFDESHAYTVGLRADILKILFFIILSAACVAALQTVGACLVIAMVITPGATAYLLSNKFKNLIFIAVAMGSFTGGFGAYCSYFLDANPGGLIVIFQTVIFISVFVFAPRYGLLKRRSSVHG